MEIPQVSKALAHACCVVTHFHHSSKSSYVIKQKKIDLHVEELSLVQDLNIHGETHRITWRNVWFNSISRCVLP